MKMLSFFIEVWILMSILYIQVDSQPNVDFKNIVQPFDEFYTKCAPVVTCNANYKYRTMNGSCNNLENPSWGSSMTPYIRLGPATYSDNNHTVRMQSDNKKLTEPRVLQLNIFLPKSITIDDFRNFHVTQFCQWIAHDITLMPGDFTSTSSCCAIQNSNNLPPQCELIIKIPSDDPVYSAIGKKCLEFRRAMTSTLNFNCPLTPQIPLNQASAFIDSSQLYGHNDAKASSLRTNKDGKLKTELINGQEFIVQQQRNGSSLCDGRNNVSVCFDGGDPRRNQQFGIIMYQTVFVRFHNFLTEKLKEINKSWTDEDLYQEARRLMNAIIQIATYRDYLPILLGKEYAEKTNLTLLPDVKTVYKSYLIPQLAVEFVAATFRVPHNQVPPVYFFLDEFKQLKATSKLNKYMSYPDPIVQGDNLEQLLRGMSLMPSRLPIPSYNSLISNFMFHDWIPLVADQDLLSIDIQRGRDVGVMTYVQVRERCGLSKVSSFEDLVGVLNDEAIELLMQFYPDVTDIDLLVGSLLEFPVDDAMVGETARCIIADGFYRLRYTDRLFCDIEGQPGSFTKDQFDVLWNLKLSDIFCAMTSIDQLPSNFFMSMGYSEMETCKRPLDLNLNAWKTDVSN